ncbi:MAG TPA: hypothetical protein DGG95_01615 [Cytophagales bacterium]|nr:hypothetical protein [Cytophagales bacterium]
MKLEWNIGKRLYEIFVQLLLIVVGVLSALGVDNYREGIQEHKLEKEYLINLRNAVETDTLALKTEIKKTYTKVNAIKELIELSKSKKEVDNDKFGDIISDVTTLIRPNFVTAVYEELKFTGNFKLIRNNKLKSLIISYYSDNALILEQNDKNDWGGYPTEFMDHVSLDELDYTVPFNQKKILQAIQEHEVVMNELLRSQKRSTHIRSGLIYTSLPRSIELLVRLQEEIDK